MADRIGDCKERVAYDLMTQISNAEQKLPEAVYNRDYVLTLYRQCYKAVSPSFTISEVLDKTS